MTRRGSKDDEKSKSLGKKQRGSKKSRGKKSGRSSKKKRTSGTTISSECKIQKRIAQKKASRKPQTDSNLTRSSKSKDFALCAVLKSDPRIGKSVKTLLTSFVSHELQPEDDMFPRFHFAMTQACAVATEFHDFLKAKSLGLDDIREGIENLNELVDYFWKCSKPVAVRLANLLDKLVNIIEELATLLEQQMTEDATNWKAMRKKLQNMGPISEIDVASIVPPTSMFEPVRILGQGGFGTIYKAKIGGSKGITCTVKVVPRSMFEYAKHACVDKVVASMINHQFLVRYYSSFSTAKYFISVMEYIRGVDLLRVVHRRSGLPAIVIRVVMAQLGLALKYLHCKGFIHRDVKPSNMMVMPGSRAKLIDFDTVKICIGKFCTKSLRGFNRRTTNEFNDGESAGTPNFFPPEVIKGDPYGRSIDWWAAGITAFQMHYGRVPFRGKTEKHVNDKILAGELPPFPSDGFHAFLRDTIQKNQVARLCSTRYDQFESHEFFATIDFESFQRTPVAIEYAGISDLMAAKGGEYSPLPPSLSGIEAPTELHKMAPTDKHLCLFTFASVGFLAVMKKVLKGEKICEKDIHETRELVLEQHSDGASDSPFTDCVTKPASDIRPDSRARK